MIPEGAPADTEQVDPERAGARPPMLFQRDLPVEVRDGIVLRANVYRPTTDIDVVPVIMAFGPYGKTGRWPSAAPSTSTLSGGGCSSSGRLSIPRVGRELGEPGAAPARKHRGLSRGRLASQMAQGDHW